MSPGPGRWPPSRAGYRRLRGWIRPSERSRRPRPPSRRQNLARKELAWLRRGPPARTSKPRFRIEAAEALIADVPPARDSVELLRFATNRLGRTVLELEDATATIAGRVLLDRVTWRIGPGDRIGIVGVNGSGKTTLLRTLAGERPLDGGRLVTGSTVALAQLNQERWMPGDLRVLEATGRWPSTSPGQAGADRVLGWWNGSASRRPGSGPRSASSPGRAAPARS